MELNNFTKRIFKNFIQEFEGTTPQQVEPFIYSMILNLFVTAENLNRLNIYLRVTAKELYLIELQNPVKEFYY